MNFNKKSINLLPLLTEVVSQSAKKAALLQTLRQAEHKSANWPNPYVVIVGHANYPELTQMTAGEWRYSQLNEKLPERFGGGVMDYPDWVSQSKSKPTNATGAYQIIYKTLGGLMDGGYVNEDDIMTKEKQDELAWDLVNQIGGVDWNNLPDQLTHEIVDKLARVWASLPGVISHGDCTSKYGKDTAKCFKIINEYYTEALGIEPEDVEVVVKKDEYGPKNTEDIMMSKDIIEKGDKGKLVSFIQNILLNDYNIDLGENGIDGNFQQETHEAILTFQRQFGLKPDGIVGPCTLDTLLEGRVRYCCKSGACKKDYCKDSDWCAWQRGMKNKLNTTEKKVDRKNYSDIEDIIPEAPCSSLQLAQIPNAPNAWRSGQPTAEELVWIIETYNIEHIVRMNGDSVSDKSARCGGTLTTKEEEEIAEYYGVKWYGNTTHTSGGSFYSSHGKGKPGEGRNITGGSVPPIVDLIGEGNVLVHCRNGADRTGQMVGAFLSDNGWGTPEQIWDYAIKFNNWGGSSGHICEPGGNWGYIKYMEAFYPLRDWCQADENRSSCSSCKNIDKIDKIY